MDTSASIEWHAARGSVCFIHTSPAMVHLLAGSGPDAMGGAELQMFLLGRELIRRGWDVSYLVGDYGQDLSDADNGFHVEAIQAGRDGAVLGTARALCRFWRGLANVDADIYITRGLTAQTGVVAGFTEKHGKQSVFWFGKNSDALYAVPRLSDLPVSERVPAWYGMRHVSAVVCQTRQQLDLLSRYVGRPGVLIRNVAPWERIAPGGGALGPILWVGSIQPKKQPQMLLDIAMELPHIEFIMVGGRMTSYDRLYEATVARASQLPNVHYLGFIPHTEIAQYFQSCAALVSTSNGEHEGFPNVFLQAWSTGLPVVAAYDPDDIIREHGLGYACACTADFVKAISRIREHPGLRDSIAGRARAYVQQHHSAERVGHQLDRLLRSLTEVGVAEVADPQTTP